MISTAMLLATFMAILLIITKPLGLWLFPIAQGQSPYGLKKADGWLFKLFFLKNTKQTWYEYALCLLTFNVVGLVVLYLLQRLQAYLPFNPQDFPAISADQAFNTAVSFVTNTNWQSYAGETTMSYFTQMAGLTVQNFVSAATGICVAFVVMRGFAFRETVQIGNFWADLVRTSFWVLLPICLIYSLFLISQGCIQNLLPYLNIETLTGDPQTIAMGPVASQEAIKLLGTNGGGFFNANSSHPFENPNALTNFVECLSIFAIAAALPYCFGLMVGDRREGWTIWGAMASIFVICVISVAYFESASTPTLLQAGASDTLMNMEGKEVRFDLASTSLFTVVTTSASCGAVNNMHDSLTPLAGMIAIWLMQLSEVIYGGVGSGFYGMIIFIVLGVFIAGLMVGRTPEYLGKKITPCQMKLASFAMLVTPLVALTGTAITCFYPDALNSLNNPNAHGFSEYLYAWSSAANNNGSAFAGLNANTLFFNYGLAIAMWLGRFLVIAALLALGGSLAEQKHVPSTSGTLCTHGVLFMFFLVGVILLIGALTFLPSLALGPIAEHLSLYSAH